MKQITLRHEQPQISIDGIVFDLQMSDYDIIKRCQEIFTKFKGYEKSKHSVDEIIADLTAIRSTIDAMLGDGAMAKLAQGKPVGIALAIEWVAAIAQALSEEYAENAAR
jgi:hypothetical protein